ncbi:hypothetical protein BKA62DRAFT_680978 [Auriculariales sp. MPI-PUGE-AT-0066]|nr:hypothetical protein BKA62DRAFT_680978 [Auriculariales sp. MPI-PUGE-AT-0066]
MLSLTRRVVVARNDPFQVFAALAQLTHCRRLLSNARPPQPTPKELKELLAALRKGVQDRRFDIKLSPSDVASYNNRLQQLRLALIDGALDKIVDVLDSFKKDKLIGLVRLQEWRELAYFVEDSLKKRHSVLDADSMPPESILEDLAVDAAAAFAGGNGEAAFALKFLLLEKLRRRDHQGALNLYHRWLTEAQMVGADMVHTEKSHQRIFTEPAQQLRAGDKDALAFSEDLSPEISSDIESQLEGTEIAHHYVMHSPGVLELHLCAMAAYYALDDLPGAVNTMVGVQISMRPPPVATFAQGLFTSQMVGSDYITGFIVFVENVRVARLIARPIALVNEVKSLATLHDANRVIALYQTVVQACHNAPTWTTPSASGHVFELRMLEPVWVEFFKAFSQMRLLPQVLDAWKEITVQGIERSQALWNVYLLALATCGKIRLVLLAWRQMVSEGLLDTVSYSTMLKQYVAFDLVDDAVALFNHIVHQDWRPTGPGSEIISEASRRQMTNIVIDGLLQAAAMKKDPAYLARAESVYNTLKKAGPGPDIFTHNAFLKYYTTIGDIAGAARRLKALSTSDLKPDGASFTIILQGLLKTKHPDPTKATLDLMAAFGVERTRPIFDMILQTIIGNDGTPFIELGMKLLDSMEIGAILPDERTYSIFLAGLFRQRSIRDEQKVQYEEEIRDRLARRNITIDLLSYNHILAACLEPAAIPTSFMVATGLRYFHEMIRRGVMPSSKGWQLVLSAVWLQQQNAHETMIVLDTMKRLGFRPDSRLGTLIERIRRQIRASRQNLF